MKVVIPSYNRAQTISTHKLLDAAGYDDYLIILHTEEQAAEYRKNPTIRPEKIHVSGQPRGISNQRRYIARKLIPFSHWYLTLDDNIRGFKGVDPLHYWKPDLPVQEKSFDRRIFEYEFGWDMFMKRVEDDQRYCKHHGIHYAGFATVPNFYFLGKKYRQVGYVISKAALIHNMGLEYDPNLEAMEDFGFTAENLRVFGKVLINNFMWPVAGHYEAGGIGTYEQRLPRKIRDCEYLMAKYPGLFRYKVKAGCHPKAELQVRFTSPSQVEAWRQGFLKAK